MRDLLFKGEKRQTIRCLYIPEYEIGETIQIKYNKIPIYEAEVEDIYPKRLKNISLREAKQDGFNSIEECISGVMKLNNIKSKNHWSFIIRFKPKHIPSFETLVKITTPVNYNSILNYITGESKIG